MQLLGLTALLMSDGLMFIISEFQVQINPNECFGLFSVEIYTK